MGLTSDSWSLSAGSDVVEVRARLVVLGVEYTLLVNNRRCDQITKRGLRLGSITLRGSMPDGVPIRVFVHALTGTPVLSVEGREFQMRHEY